MEDGGGGGEEQREETREREREKGGGESQSSSHYLLTGIKTTIKPFDLPLAAWALAILIHMTDHWAR